jgi:glucokinase
MHIGLDVGGTKMEGIVFSKGKIITSLKEPTKKTPKEFIAQIEKVISILLQDRKIKGIGICFPGSVDRNKGKINSMPSLPLIRNFDIVKTLEKKFKIPVIIENDGNCMAWGEYLWGLGKNTKNFVAMTLGTGVGGGFVFDGKLYDGRGNAAEVGHINLVPEGQKCFCGSRGCLEEYASGRGIMRFAKELKLEAKDPYEVEVLARKGNKKAKEAYRRAGYYLGIGISTIIKNVDPDLVVLSGSVSKANDLFLEETRKTMKKNVWFPCCDIKVSFLKSAPAIGAASLFEK